MDLPNVVYFIDMCFLVYSYQMIAFAVMSLCNARDVAGFFFSSTNDNPESVISIACFTADIHSVRSGTALVC